MTPSPAPRLGVSPNIRTKEENQERAFIAASRRKDRSLDARVESANRASALHKQRTGRALHISRDIVKDEAMYEEIDCNYQAKLQRMMHAQTLQLEQDFNRKLLEAMRNNPQGIQQRRASSLTPRGPVHGGRKMSLDLSRLRSSISESMNPGSPMTSPVVGMGGNPNCIMSPSFGGSTPSQSYPMATPTASSTGQMQSYVTQAGQVNPTWMAPTVGGPQLVQQPWEGFYAQNNPLAQHMYNGLPSMPALRQFRDRMGSAPAIPVHAIQSASNMAAAAAAAATVTTGAPLSRPVSQHARVRSEPSKIVHPSLSTSSGGSSDASSTFATATAPTTEMSSPQLDLSSSSELLPTPDLCPTPNTPNSPATSHPNNSGVDLTGLDLGNEKWTTEFMSELDLGPDYTSDITSMFPRGPSDPEYLDFSQFASTLDNSNNQVQFGPDGTVNGMEEMTGMEEYTVSA